MSVAPYELVNEDNRLRGRHDIRGRTKPSISGMGKRAGDPADAWRG
jgi:hypothetical protein